MAFQAVSPDFLRKFRLIGIYKAIFLEEIRMIGKGEDTLNAKIFRFFETFPYQRLTDARMLIFFLYGKGSDFSKVLPQYSKGANTYNSAFVIVNEEIPDALIEFVKGAGEHLFFSSELIYNLLNLLNVSYYCLSNLWQAYIL